MLGLRIVTATATGARVRVPAVKHVHRCGDGAASAVDVQRAIICSCYARAWLRCVLARDVLRLGVGSVVVAAALSLT